MRAGQRRGEDNDKTTTGTPNHARKQLVTGWKQGAAEWQEDEGTRGWDDEGTRVWEDDKRGGQATTATTTTTHHHSTSNHRREQLLAGWKGGATRGRGGGQ